MTYLVKTQLIAYFNFTKQKPFFVILIELFLYHNNLPMTRFSQKLPVTLEINVKLVNKVKKVYHSTEFMKLKYQRTSSLEAFQPILPELITQHNMMSRFTTLWIDCETMQGCHL